ncbi:MerR family transcriptional regulator [Nannocystis pusilla]|uniref:HTH merR-type domain-containing protein n=1 Tax=Nannocystis pusilla TaxID=889268 RepID=A0ABS7TM50_9BACT|nr:hypothetical protein [Nannocystis pusilla]MBZ5709302.1 hypothetical protein [Nannocystis pusilla]
MTDQRIVDPAFCTTQDLMEAAGVTTLTVRNWVERGLLPKPTALARRLRCVYMFPWTIR